MALLNYTTSVPVSATIQHIHKQLVQAGARSVLVEYEEGKPMGIAFTAETPAGARHFVLPVDVAKVLGVLKRDKVQPRYSTPEQAERVAWRILKDWLEAQLAIIRTEMVTLDQIMLPYMQADDGRTVYEVYRDQQFALPRGDT